MERDAYKQEILRVFESDASEASQASPPGSASGGRRAKAACTPVKTMSIVMGFMETNRLLEEQVSY